jgi:hypothetical protein
MPCWSSQSGYSEAGMVRRQHGQKMVGVPMAQTVPLVFCPVHTNNGTDWGGINVGLCRV